MVSLSDSEPSFPYEKIRERLEAAVDSKEFGAIVANGPFQYELETTLLFLGLITFFLVDEQKQCVRLAGVSDTEYYRMSVKDYKFSPAKYEVPLRNTGNSLVQAITSGDPIATTDWGTLSREQSSDDAARLNQASGGIGSSFAYPLPGKARGVLLFAYFQYPDAIGSIQRKFMERYAQLVVDCLAERVS
jgi:hypothetical protein